MHGKETNGAVFYIGLSKREKKNQRKRERSIPNSGKWCWAPKSLIMSAYVGSSGSQIIAGCWNNLTWRKRRERMNKPRWCSRIYSSKITDKAFQNALLISGLHTLRFLSVQQTIRMREKLSLFVFYRWPRKLTTWNRLKSKRVAGLNLSLIWSSTTQTAKFMSTK